MRFIFKLLLGAFIFNVLFVALSPFFPIESALEETAKEANVTSTASEKSIGKLKNIGSTEMLKDMIINGAIVFISALVIAGIAGRLTNASFNGTILIGAAMFISFISMLWTASKSILVPLTQYDVVSDIYDLVIIITGIIIVISVIEMFVGQGETV